MDEERLETAEGGTEDGGFLDGWEETGEEVVEEAAGSGEPETAAGERARETPEAPEDGAETAVGEDGNVEAGQGGGETAQQRTWRLEGPDGQAVNCGEANLVELARKGLDYDRQAAEYAALWPGVELLNAFAQKAGVTLADYVTDLRVRLKQSDGMDEDTARQTVELEAREAALAAREAKERAEQEAAQRQAEERRSWEARRDADIQTFAQAFPEVAADPKSIPKEVWEAVGGGLSLTAAYAVYVRHQQEQAEQAEARQRQQAAENAARSTGTMRSAGSGAAGKDPFLEGWENP